jgi:hypothetical protein
MQVEPLPWFIEHATWLSLPLAVVVLLVGRWLMVYVGGARSRSQATERIVALGPPRSELRGSDEDTTITLRGQLRVEKEPCFRYQDEQPCAATTFQISNVSTWYDAPDFAPNGTRRAPKLELVTPNHVIALEGEVIVEVGSHEYWPGVDIRLLDERVALRVVPEVGDDPRDFEGYCVFRSLQDGDEVVVKGKISRNDEAGGRAASYRQQGMRWRMKPADSDGIALAYTKPPHFRTRPRWLLAGPGLFAAAALVAYSALFVDHDSHEASRSCMGSCRARGDCQPRASWGLLGVRIDCQRSEVLPCGHMDACAQRGLCTPKDGECVATSDDACKAAAACKSEGRCSAKDGRCQLTSNADCEKTAACEDDGHCTAHLDRDPPACDLGSDADCERTSDCRLRAMCTYAEGACRARSAQDCAGARYCADEGLCSYSPGDRRCHAGSDEDCERSMACSVSQRCVAHEGVCRTEVEVSRERLLYPRPPSW